jgi:hypothetical protein
MNPLREALTKQSRKEPKPATVRKDEAKVEAWAEVGHDRRVTYKSRSRQKYPSARFSENYGIIRWTSRGL